MEGNLITSTSNISAATDLTSSNSDKNSLKEKEPKIQTSNLVNPSSEPLSSPSASSISASILPRTSPTLLHQFSTPNLHSASYFSSLRSRQLPQPPSPPPLSTGNLSPTVPFPPSTPSLPSTSSLSTPKSQSMSHSMSSSLTHTFNASSGLEDVNQQRSSNSSFASSTHTLVSGLRMSQDSGHATMVSSPRHSQGPQEPLFGCPEDYLNHMLGDLHLLHTMYLNEEEEPNLPSFSTSLPTCSRNDHSCMQKNRAKAMNEIVTTEITYYEMLTSLIDLVVDPIYFACKQPKGDKKSALPMVASEDFSKLFCNIKEIQNFHSTLLMGLRERYSLWNDQQKISDIFLATLPFMKIYIQYMANYPTALATLSYYKKNSPEFLKLLENAEKSPRFKSLTIVSFLILPIQRVPRYILLLEQLLRFTSPDHLDYMGLQKCVEEVKQIAEHINEAIRRFELQTKVVELQSQITGRAGSLVTPARRWVEQVECYKVTRMGHLEKRMLFLFTDLVMVAKKIHEEKFEFKMEWDLHDPSIFLSSPTTTTTSSTTTPSTANADAPHASLKFVNRTTSALIAFPSAAVRDRTADLISKQLQSIRSSGLHPVELTRTRSLSPSVSRPITTHATPPPLPPPTPPLPQKEPSNVLSVSSSTSFVAQLRILSHFRASLKRRKRSIKN